MPDSSADIIFPVAFWILILANLIGNSLVILIILTNRSMKSPLNYLLVNLAVADIMVGIFKLPDSIIQYFVALPDGSKGQIFCRFLSIDGVSWLGGASSVFSLTAICFERYFAVMYPYSARLRMNNQKVRRIVITSWTYASVLSGPLYGLMTINYNKEKRMCIEEWLKEPSWLSKLFSAAWFTATGFSPLVIMLVLYSRVIYNLWFKQHQVQGTQLAMLKSRKRVTKMVVIVSVAFFVTWIPTLLFYAAVHDNVAFPKSKINVSGSVMVLLNSTINPFIYALQSNNFSRHLRDIIACCRTHGKNRVVPLNKRDKSSAIGLKAC